jgi:general secretion pathway protein F/type IV pilus assembly protein PilC
VFNEMAVSMVRAGGEGAFLEEALDRVATFTEQQEDLKSRTVGALAYPMFLATIGTLVVTGLLVFFVPNFEEMFARLKERGELPAMTTWLIDFSKWLQTWGWIPLLVVIALAIWAKVQIATEQGRAVFDRVKLRMPLAGNIFLSLAVARFCRVLGTMMRNGVPILKALEISREATGNRVLSEAIEEASENVTSGESLSKPLAASGHFPPSVVEMIAVAEESNTLDSVLTEIADGLERRTQRQLDLMVRLLEPIMLLILACIVLVVVIALLRPVLTMGGAI